MTFCLSSSFKFTIGSISPAARQRRHLERCFLRRGRASRRIHGQVEVLDTGIRGVFGAFCINLDEFNDLQKRCAVLVKSARSPPVVAERNLVKTVLRSMPQSSRKRSSNSVDERCGRHLLLRRERAIERDKESSGGKRTFCGFECIVYSRRKGKVD